MAVEACGASTFTNDETVLLIIQAWSYGFSIWLLWAVTLLPLGLRAYRIPDSRPCRPLMVLNAFIVLLLLALAIAVAIDQTRSLQNALETSWVVSYKLDAALRLSYHIAALYAGITMTAAWMKRPRGGPKGTVSQGSDLKLIGSGG